MILNLGIHTTMNSAPSIPEEIIKLFDKSSIALSLASAGNDKPLIAANKKFCELTGYDLEEIVGKNCRFLQGTYDNTDAKKNIHQFLNGNAGLSIRQPLINVKADGTPFINLLYMSRLCDGTGKTQFILASQFDISNTHTENLNHYGVVLGDTLKKITPLAYQAGIILEGSIAALANSTAMIAQAKLTLAELQSANHIF